MGDSVLHIELRCWADIMVIASLSANTLSKATASCEELQKAEKVMTCAGPGISLWEPTASLSRDVILYTDEDEQSRWNTIGDSLLPIELCDWADIMVIAPLSANTPSKIAKGLCDNLLSFVGYAWDFSKPLFVAPAMNTLMWNNLFMQ
ncbi:hypothetical protein GBA52_023723 [Prunus armeniaca]|nr:hypothetical protein GBA52_023723 [Prunus armeniaca]